MLKEEGLHDHLHGADLLLGLRDSRCHLAGTTIYLGLDNDSYNFDAFHYDYCAGYSFALLIFTFEPVTANG